MKESIRRPIAPRANALTTELHLALVGVGTEMRTQYLTVIANSSLTDELAFGVGFDGWLSAKQCPLDV